MRIELIRVTSGALETVLSGEVDKLFPQILPVLQKANRWPEVVQHNGLFYGLEQWKGSEWAKYAETFGVIIAGGVPAADTAAPTQDVEHVD